MGSATWVMCMTLAVALFCAPFAARAQEVVAEPPAPKIQLAILLDTSGSMSGLIEQAKAQLWKIVNEFATTTKDGKAPEFEVALYHYGTPSLGKDTGYVRMILPLTTDLDKVSEELFALTTNGGDEYCGTVIKAATEQLSWSASDEDLKVIVIAGNEPFTQGEVDYRKACPAAVAKGVIVNTIHCGSYEEGVNGHWRDGAVLADGKYMNIYHNAKAVHVAAPQDAEIARLGVELNATYVAYGAQRQARAERQREQDANAARMGGGSTVQRAVSKSNAFYRNAEWDLVDAVREDKVKLDDVKDEDLPEAMRDMTPEQREAYVAEQSAKRAELQTQINDLNDARKEYVAAERKKLAADGKDTLDKVLISAMREQAEARDFQVGE